MLYSRTSSVICFTHNSVYISHQVLKPGLNCTAPSRYHLGWKKRQKDQKEDRDTSQLPIHSLAPTPDCQAMGPCLLPHPQGKYKRHQMVNYWTRIQSLSWEGPLEEGMATHSSTHVWRISWTEKLGGLQSMGWQRVRLN